MMIVGDDIIGYCPGNIFVWVGCVGINTTECWGLTIVLLPQSNICPVPRIVIIGANTDNIASQ